MPANKQKFNEIPINVGTKPDWNTRLGYPSLFNMFVGDSGFLYPTPGLVNISPQSPLLNNRALHYSSFGGGAYFVVTQNNIIRIAVGGTYSIVAQIQFSGLPVQIDENLQNQIIFVDGVNAYVLDQPANNFVILNETTNGFPYKSPIAVVVLNTFAIILDGDTNSWIISSPNNALTYDPINQVQIESQLTQALGLETLNSNLYIFGTTAIERWEPNYQTNAYAFPFSRDNNFRTDFGAFSTDSIIRGINLIYFLSSKYIPMQLSGEGLKNIADIGMGAIISGYPDFEACLGSFFSYRGNYFYYMTFPTTGISWVWCENSKTWAQSDDLIVGALSTMEVVITSDGIFSLSLTPDHKRRTWISPRVVNYEGPAPYRNVLNAFELRFVHGYLSPNPPQPPPATGPEVVELTVSIDSESWLTTVPRIIGTTGNRNEITTWQMTGLAAYEYTFRVSYYGNMNFTIERAAAILN
jgi:hypothetical protein